LIHFCFYFLIFSLLRRGFVLNVQHPVATVFLLLLAGLLQQLPQPVHLRQHESRIQAGLLQDPVRSPGPVVVVAGERRGSRRKTFQPTAHRATVSFPPGQPEPVGGERLDASRRHRRQPDGWQDESPGVLGSSRSRRSMR
jgi:hypothetical protein